MWKTWLAKTQALAQTHTMPELDETHKKDGESESAVMHKQQNGVRMNGVKLSYFDCNMLSYSKLAAIYFKRLKINKTHNEKEYKQNKNQEQQSRTHSHTRRCTV